MTFDNGRITSTAKDPESKTVYEMYYNFEEPVKKIAGHRVLALNRAEDEKVLTVKVEAPVEDILRYLEKQVITRDNPNTTPDAPYLYSYLDEFVKYGCHYVAMEASSEAFFRGRLQAMEFDVSGYTNVTSEHLNIHGTFENYLN